MRRIDLPPEGRAWWPEPLGLVGLAAYMATQPTPGSYTALVLLVGAAHVASEYRFPSR